MGSFSLELLRRFPVAPRVVVRKMLMQIPRHGKGHLCQPNECESDETCADEFPTGRNLASNRLVPGPGSFTSLRRTRMKLAVRSANARGSRFSAKAGFTLAEVMVGVGVMGIMLVSLYAGFAFGFAQIRVTRENVRATQILTEKMEVARLLNWDQVVNLPGYIPTSFTAPFYADTPTNPPPDDFIYTGTVLVTNAPITETYADNLRMIQIKVTWQSGNIARERQMTTYVAQYGMQKYIY